MNSWTQKIKRLAHWLLAQAAYWYYGRPARHLIVIGVTGTKGKSTTVRYIASVLEAGGFKVGLLRLILVPRSLGSVEECCSVVTAFRVTTGGASAR